MINEAVEILKGRGYKVSQVKEEGTTIALYKRINGADCQTNNKPPTIVVELYELKMLSFVNHSMKISLRAETASGDWCDIGWYSLPIERVDSMDEFEYLMEKMWATLN